MHVQTFYTVYQITNLINGKIYIGFHKTNNLHDDYFGSGTNIKRAIKKYGIENFKKDFIAVFDNADEMYDLEKQIVNKDFLNNKNVYNINVGGSGGWFFINSIIDKELKKSYAIKGGKSEKKKETFKRNYKHKDKIYKDKKPIDIEKKKNNAKKMGILNGGKNKLTNDDIKKRLNLINDIDLLKIGWVKLVSARLNITHTQVKRFIEKHYTGNYYKRKA